MMLTTRWKALILAVILVGLFIVLPLTLLQRNAPVTARPTKPRIDVPLVLIRGERCLLTESKAVCKARVLKR